MFHEGCNYSPIIEPSMGVLVAIKQEWKDGSFIFWVTNPMGEDMHDIETLWTEMICEFPECERCGTREMESEMEYGYCPRCSEYAKADARAIAETYSSLYRTER